MPALKLTSTCSIDVGCGFRRRVEDGDLRLSKKGRTVWAAMYEAKQPDPAASIADLYAPGRKPDEEWERRGAGVSGRAYLLSEEKGGARRWILTTLTASAREVALVSFYFDTERDLRWALDAWNSIRFSAP